MRLRSVLDVRFGRVEAIAPLPAGSHAPAGAVLVRFASSESAVTCLALRQLEIEGVSLVVRTPPPPTTITAVTTTKTSHLPRRPPSSRDMALHRMVKPKQTVASLGVRRRSPTPPLLASGRSSPALGVGLPPHAPIARPSSRGPMGYLPHHAHHHMHHRLHHGARPDGYLSGPTSPNHGVMAPGRGTSSPLHGAGVVGNGSGADVRGVGVGNGGRGAPGVWMRGGGRGRMGMLGPREREGRFAPY